MLGLVLAAALSQAPVKVAIVQSSNLGVPAKRAAELTRLLVELLQEQKLEPLEFKSPCDNRACLVGAGRELSTAGVVAVAFASVGRDTVMDLEWVNTADGKSFAQTTFTVHPSDQKLPGEALLFVRDAAKLLPPPVVAKKEDLLVPKESDPVQPPPELVLVSTSERSRAPAFVVGGLALVTGAVAAAFVAIAMNQKSQVESPISGTMMSLLTRSEGKALEGISNRNFSVSAVAGGVAAALLVGAIVLMLW